MTRGYRGYATDATRPRRTRDPARQRYYAAFRAARWRRHYFGT